MDAISYAYSGQDGEGSLPYFVGKQYGTGWLRSLARIAFPILKRVVGAAGHIAANTAEDLIENRKTFRESIKDNAIQEAGRIFTPKRPFASADSSINRGHGKRFKSSGAIKKHHTIFKK